MGVFDITEKNLKTRGYQVQVFATAKEASDYLNRELDGKKIGFGGSKTLETMGLFESLSEHNTVFWHWKQEPRVDYERIAVEQSEIYMSSANALSETGVFVNVDGTGNRLAGIMFGHEKVIFVVGKNKLAPDEQGAIDRVRNWLCPRRANDWDIQTPCVLDGTGGTKCYDCLSPNRICRGMSVLWMPMLDVDYEVILIEEDLGM